MLQWLLFAQVSAAAPPSNYSTDALRAFVAAAAAANRVPLTLAGYRARVQSELSFVLHDSLGREQATQIEQLASRAEWSRTGDYQVHVVGYRSQSVGAPFSALSFVKGWTVPTLYGDRLDFGFEPAGSDRPRRGRRDSVRAVHPLAEPRDRYYRFSGGDTIAVLRTASGEIPIVRVHVEPAIDTTSRAGVFLGELDFDATRHALVRMRGRFLVVGRDSTHRPSIFSRLPGLVAVAYAEFVNAHFQGEYWLPTFQRTEFQAAFAGFGDSRSVFRLVSRFDGYDVRRDSAAIQPDTTVLRQRRIITFAPSDSLSRFSDWSTQLGTETADVSARDFDDIGPQIWRPSGRTAVRFFPRKLDEVFRYNRVEGAYTGASMSVTFRDAAPGLSLRTYGGWAWSEQAVRGGGSATLQRGGSWLTLRGERTLASTNDFVRPLEGGFTLAALLASVDDADYLDRRLAGLSYTATLGDLNVGLATLEVRGAEDRNEIARLRHGPLWRSDDFRVNRAAAEGRYLLGSATLELRPDVTGDFLQPGVGARLHYEGATGELDWQRVEVMLAARRYWHQLQFAARADAGATFGGLPPPQTLFELGEAEGLRGYDYKEFGGDRAAIVRGMVAYTSPWLRGPRRIWRHYVVPGLAPGVAVGVSGGWVEASNDVVRSVLQQWAEVGEDGQLRVPGPTQRIRATVDARLTFLSGAVGFGVARPVDHAAPWRFVFSLGQHF